MKNIPKPFDLEYLEECLSVDFQKGELVWKFRPQKHFITLLGGSSWNAQNSGKIPKSLNDGGYYKISLNHQSYFQHRIIYALYHNDNNPSYVDHFDGNPQNNSISNLRPVSYSSNNRNRVMSNLNTSGITGVCLNKYGKWVSRIVDNNGKRISKTFEDFFEACCHRKSMEKQFEYTKRHGNVAIQ